MSTADVLEARARALRVVICDPHDVSRSGIHAVLSRDAGIAVAAVCALPADAVALARALEPDVVVLEPSLPGGDGIAATRVLRGRHRPVDVLLVTAAPDDQAAFAAAMAGASGWLPKRPLADIGSAIRRAVVGTGLSRRDMCPAGSFIEESAARDDIVRLAVAGLPDEELGDALGIPAPVAHARVVDVATRTLARSWRSRGASRI